MVLRLENIWSADKMAPVYRYSKRIIYTNGYKVTPDPMLMAPRHKQSYVDELDGHVIPLKHFTYISAEQEERGIKYVIAHKELQPLRNFV